MGAWRSIRHRLEDALPHGVPLRYVGRPWRASPSEGYPTAHLAEQDRIVREALGGQLERLRALDHGAWRPPPPLARACAPAGTRAALCAGGSLRHSLYAANANPIVLFGGMGRYPSQTSDAMKESTTSSTKSVTIALVLTPTRR